MVNRTAPLVTELRRALEDFAGNCEDPRADVNQPACTVCDRGRLHPSLEAGRRSVGRFVGLIARSVGRPSVHKFDAGLRRRRRRDEMTSRRLDDDTRRRISLIARADLEIDSYLRRTIVDSSTPISGPLSFTRTRVPTAAHSSSVANISRWDSNDTA